MNQKELQKLVAAGENERVEFKATTGQRSQAAKTVCALLNNLGGFVVFGVSDKGDIVGQKVAAGTLESIAAELRKIEPPAFPDIATVPLKKDIAAIVLTVTGGGGPYTFDGRPYLRHGPTTIVMPREEYERRLVECMPPGVGKMSLWPRALPLQILMLRKFRLHWKTLFDWGAWKQPTGAMLPPFYGVWN